MVFGFLWWVLWKCTLGWKSFIKPLKLNSFCKFSKISPFLYDSLNENAWWLRQKPTTTTKSRPESYKHMRLISSYLTKNELKLILFYSAAFTIIFYSWNALDHVIQEQKFRIEYCNHTLCFMFCQRLCVSHSCRPIFFFLCIPFLSFALYRCVTCVYWNLLGISTSSQRGYFMQSMFYLIRGPKEWKRKMVSR